MYALVVAGTKRPPSDHYPGPHILIRSCERLGKGMGLTYDTWFTPSYVQVVPLSAIREVKVVIPLAKFLEFEPMVPSKEDFAIMMGSLGVPDVAE